MHVLAKAYGGVPLDRTLTGAGNGVFYVEKPSVQNANGIRRTSGVGFPKSAVFSFESGLYERLLQASEAGDLERLDALWSEAKPLPVDLSFEFAT